MPIQHLSYCVTQTWMGTLKLLLLLYTAFELGLVGAAGAATTPSSKYMALFD